MRNAYQEPTNSVEESWLSAYSASEYSQPPAYSCAGVYDGPAHSNEGRVEGDQLAGHTSPLRRNTALYAKTSF